MKKIDYKKSKIFWDSRAEKHGRENFLLATTLQDALPAISDYRDKTEKKHLFSILKLGKEMRVLDLGGGTGRWTLELAKKVKEVILVDFSHKLLNIAKQRTQEGGLTNIHFIESSVIDFYKDEKFDTVLLSGVLMYINDEDLDVIAGHCYDMLKRGGCLVLREGVHLNNKLSQIEEYVPELQSEYSVIWRKPEEYLEIFGKWFSLEYEKDAFPYLIPVFLYKRIIPNRFKEKRAFQNILKRLLLWQSYLDPFLLKFNLGINLYYNWLKKHGLAVNARFYIFRKDSEKAQYFHFADKNVVDIAKDKRTPFFLISEKEILKNYKEFIENFPSSIKPKIYYSVKTNYESGILLYIQKLGMGAEVGSALDLFLAQKAEFKPSEIILDGLVKESALLEKVIDIGIKTINIESFLELTKINEIAQRHQRIVNVGIRLNINRRWGDWRNFLTDRNQKSFGINIKEVMDKVNEFRKYQYINVSTLMIHTSKSFTTPYDYSFTLKKIFRLAIFLKKHGIIINEFNLGGGIPIPGNNGYCLADFGRIIGDVYLKESKLLNYLPLLSFELGKSLVGNAAILVGRVCAVRKDWVIVDISRSDYGFSFPFRERRFLIANKLKWPKDTIMRVGSSNLEKFDVIKKSVRLPYVSPGDIAVLLDVGAYSLPLSTQFTRPRSAVYLLTDEGKEILIRQRETPEDVVFKQNWEF